MTGAEREKTAGRVSGFRALTADTATGTRTPLREIPQSIVALPREVIDSQQSLGVGDALRNVSAIQPNDPRSTPAFDSLLLRGFAAEQFLDGVALYQYAPGDRESLINVERIEVVKGASAVRFGGGSGATAGGLVNIISKMNDEGFLQFAFLPATVDLTNPVFGTPFAPPGNGVNDLFVKNRTMLAYPGFTALAGPQYMFANLMGATVHVVAKTRQPVRSDTGLTIVPDATFDETPGKLTVLFVPGSGSGLFGALEDAETMRFLSDRGARAEWVTSVCTGSVLLAAAGLLDGYRATSHWVTEAALEPLGARLEPERVVIDRNRITGAGVTAGVDFGLKMLEVLRDRDYAMAIQLLAQYDPAPPFDAGSLASAPPHVSGMMQAMFPGFVQRAVEAGRAARAALP